VTPPDNDQVREVRCIVLVPQVRNHQSVTLPRQPPDDDLLSGMEPLGWIHTQPNELIQNGMQIIPAPDVVTHASILIDNPEAYGPEQMRLYFSPTLALFLSQIAPGIALEKYYVKGTGLNYVITRRIGACLLLMSGVSWCLIFRDYSKYDAFGACTWP
jgi:hypothetical protein